jgi:aminomethyltransferase
MAFEHPHVLPDDSLLRSSRMKRTPLYDRHVALGAKLVDFAGWEMPIQYSGVVDEYRHVRQAAGMFDVSHMGRIRVSGGGSLAFLQRITTNNVASVPLLGSQYSMVCNEHGGILDDIFVYRTQPAEYLLCVNASNRDKILAWLRTHASSFSGVVLDDASTTVGQLALQGPASASILEKAGLTDVAALKPRTAVPVTLEGTMSFVSRTGYTGEPGWELYVPATVIARVWDNLMRAGADVDIRPAGLGARDLLRLEMAYLLYGNDIAEDTTPLEANAAWVVDFGKGDFIGRDRLWAQHVDGAARRLVAFELTEKGVPRHGFNVYASEAESHEIGVVTSGNLSPLLQKGIGLAYVAPSYAGPGTRLLIDIRGRRLPAVVIKPPFYRRSKT